MERDTQRDVPKIFFGTPRTSEIPERTLSSFNVNMHRISLPLYDTTGDHLPEILAEGNIVEEHARARARVL